MSTDPNDTVQLCLKIPRWVKELVREAAEAESLSLSVYASHALVGAARDTIEVPSPPPAAAPIPTVSDVLREYVSGDSRLIGPCGERWPCSYDPQASKYIGDAEFCSHCDVRVS